VVFLVHSYWRQKSLHSLRLPDQEASWRHKHEVSFLDMCPLESPYCLSKSAAKSEHLSWMFKRRNTRSTPTRVLLSQFVLCTPTCFLKCSSPACTYSWTVCCNGFVWTRDSQSSPDQQNGERNSAQHSSQARSKSEVGQPLHRFSILAL
jgi:hypothetical protein